MLVACETLARSPPCNRARPHRQRVARLRAAPDSSSDSLAITGLPGADALCDAFVCNSSPQAEVTLRQVARDLDNVREGASRTLSAFSESVQFADPVRQAKGVAALRRYEPNTALLSRPRSRVATMAMRGMDTAVITWSVTGETAAGMVALNCESALELNLITGRVLKQRDSWTFAPSSTPLASLLYLLRRSVYSGTQNLQDLAAGVARALEEWQQGDGGNEQVYADPADPMKFFQQSDNTQQDAALLALILACLWLVGQVMVLTG